MVSGRLTYRPAVAEDTKAIIKLSDNYFGKAYLNSENIKQYIRHPDSLVYVAENKKEVIGFGIFHLLMQWELIYHLGKSLGNRYENFNPHDRILLIKSLAVQPEFRGKGYGKNLVCSVLKEKKTDHQLLSIIWESKASLSMERICKSLGMKLWFRAENFWLKDSTEKNYNCPVCGNPCMCNALIYKKTKTHLNAI